MQYLKERVIDWDKTLIWACQGLKDTPTSNDQYVQDSIAECFSKKVDQPRLSSLTNAMIDVDTHFRKTNVIDIPTLDLYQTLLRTTRTELLAFLASCAKGDVEEKFVEMPTELISQMRGRPCRTRDLEILPIVPMANKPFSKIPSILTCDIQTTNLYVRGEKVASIQASGFLVPIPTSSTLEQLVIIAAPNGDCKLISTTRKNMEIVGEFSIDVEDKLDWIDIISTKNNIILYWGGTDPLRGQSTWNYYSGINLKKLTKDDLFYDVPDAIAILESTTETAKKQHDFTTHGNLLTLWTRHVESETDGKRQWKSNQLAVLGAAYSSTPIESALELWGSPQQFISLHHCSIKSWVCGEFRSSFTIDSADHACVLYAHSR
jgi:hypothetical protein